MRRIDVAGWSRCHWQSNSGWLSPGAMEEAEVVSGSDCFQKEEAEVEEVVGALESPLWCHSLSYGRGCW